MFERFTGDARHIVVMAQEQARELRHNYIGTEHVLLSIVRLPNANPARDALFALGLTPEKVLAAVEKIAGRGNEAPSGHIPFTQRAKRVLELSLRESLQLGSNNIGPEHVLLGLIREGEGLAAQVLAQSGRSLDDVRAAVLAAIRQGDPGITVTRTPAVEQVLAEAERLAAGAPIGSHHLLEALARADASMAGMALAGLGVTADAVTEKIDDLDLAATSDVTPEQSAAATMRWEVGDEQATLVIGDPDTVAALRKLVEQAEGPLHGDGPLSGPFIALYQAVRRCVSALDTALNPPSAPDAEPAPTTLRERLRRRRRP
jgi:ATP-dependent Clp protease ATP-binding subunit ClpA